MNGPSALPAPAAPRSLLPQEHGAWGQLAMPLVTGLALARPTLSAALLAAGTVLAFLAHEPWLVALGHRGERARISDGPRALRAMLGLLAAAAVTGGTGLWLAPPAVRLAALIPAALAALVVLLVMLEQERTLPGELTVAFALAGAGALVALASGAPPRAATAAFATWVMAFGTSVFAVQTVLVRARTRGARDPGLLHAAAVILILVSGSAAARAGGIGWAVPAAVLPTAALSLVVCLARFSPKRLRLLGWSLVAATTATLAVLLAASR
ncbi:MAG TPA: YwiC-like family protein [Anaeromyxobacteraceae bacterium]|nr:YwiC-like family protein [Anaeromyxobacteraceae bacterium]